MTNAQLAAKILREIELHQPKTRIFEDLDTAILEMQNYVKSKYSRYMKNGKFRISQKKRFASIAQQVVNSLTTENVHPSHAHPYMQALFEFAPAGMNCEMRAIPIDEARELAAELQK